MKKLIIGAVVGGILLFFWQFLSFTVLNLHSSMQAHTPKQDEIIQYLNNNLEEGFYFMPTYPPGTNMEDANKMMEAYSGKPWAQVYLHKSMNTNMTSNMARGLVVDILAVLCLAWLFGKFTDTSLQNIFIASLAVGLLSYMTTSYLNAIWFETHSIPDLIDAVVGWGIVGLWLGWWINKK